MKTTQMNVKLTFTEPLLGTTSANKEIHEKYIASLAPTAANTAEEVAMFGTEAVIESGMTIFPRNDDGVPILWDYQIKGFFKDACQMLSRVDGTASKKLKAFKKVIDGLIFPNPRRIPITVHGEIRRCQRPLRAQTAMGEKIALSSQRGNPC